MCGGPEGTAGYMIGNALYDEWRRTGRRQTAIARILGVTPTYLSRLSNGRQRLSTRMAALMHTRLGWPSLDYLNAQIYADYDREIELDFERQRSSTPDTGE